MARGTSANQNQFTVLNASNASSNANSSVQQDQDSIYHVHPSEGPNSVTVTPKLTKSNYNAWARAMRRALGAKNKFSFVDGSIPIPDETDLNRRAWERCNNLIHSWIMNSITESIGQSVVYIENVVDVWRELKEQFSKADRIRVSKLRSEINSLKQGSKSVTDYFGELRILWQELESYRPIPTCTCPRQCICAAMKSAREFRLEDEIMQFLTGLNENFSIVRTQILLMEPLPQLNKVYSMVLQEESQLNPEEKSDESEALINAVDRGKSQGRGRGNGSNYGNRYNSKMCTYCGKIGHTIETCYKKHGFPPSYGRGNGSGFPPSYGRGNGNPTVNAVNSDYTDTKSVTAAGNFEEQHTNTPPTFTQEQYDRILAMLQHSTLQSSQQSTTQSGNVNQVSLSSHFGHQLNETSTSGFEIQEDDWFG